MRFKPLKEYNFLIIISSVKFSASYIPSWLSHCFRYLKDVEINYNSANILHFIDAGIKRGKIRRFNIAYYACLSVTYFK